MICLCKAGLFVLNIPDLTCYQKLYMLKIRFDIVENYGFDIQSQNGLTSYTKHWDKYINGYLREGSDIFFDDDDDFIDEEDIDAVRY